MAQRRKSPAGQKVGQQRQRDRKKAFSDAKERHDRYSRRSGAANVGRDEDGLVKETRTVTALRMKVDNWHVQLNFKREDSGRLKNSSWRDVEAALKEGRVPRKQVRYSTHIITAVRALKHVRQGYEEELSSTDQLLASLDEENLSIARKKGQATDADIDNLLETLRSVRKVLIRKRTAVKRIVGLNRLDETGKMFRNAKDIPLGPRGVHLSRACAVFTSLRARLGTWRDKEVAGIAEYTLQRECALRAARDRWLYSQLAKFAGAPHRIYGYVVKDSEKRDLLVKVRGMLDGDATRQEVMRCLWANRELFSREKTKPEFLAGHYGWVHRYVKAEELDKAKAKLDYLILFTDANKPRFVLDELSKDTDPYLKPVVELMLTAVQAFEAKDFKTAKEYFTQAANSMRRVAYG